VRWPIFPAIGLRLGYIAIGVHAKSATVTGARFAAGGNTGSNEEDGDNSFHVKKL